MSHVEKSYESRLYMAENGYYTDPTPFGYSKSNYSLKMSLGDGLLYDVIA